MQRQRNALGVVLALAIALLCGGNVLAADSPFVGNWKLVYISGPTEFTQGLLKLEEKAGKIVGEYQPAARTVTKPTLGSLDVDGKKIRAVLKSPTGEMVFEGQLSSKDAKKVLGSFGDDRRIVPATLTATEKTNLEGVATAALFAHPAPMKNALALQQRGASLRREANQATDPKEKADLLKLAAEAEERAKTQLPALYREVIEKHADSPAVFEAALNLLRGASKSDATPAQAKAWAQAASKIAANYGQRMQGEINLQIAEALASQKPLADLAVEFASGAEKGLQAKDSTARQIRTLEVLAAALKNAGESTRTKSVEGRLAKLEGALDKEFLAKVPPFKAQPFGGRKEKSERAVVMELFTGAQCPPCVAADVAFDVLQRSYQPRDLILIQYHMHIPGPDPLTNADSEARWEYYRKTFPEGIRGTPSTLFNGKPGSGGGGNMAMSEGKYNAYRQLIDPLLETQASAKLSGSATAKDNKIKVKVNVAELQEPSESKKLRLVLVEETVRYVGGNQLRFHHQVVRAFPGGVEGKALTDAAVTHEVVLDLNEVRGRLNEYLDDYAANKRAFPSAKRPLDLKNLRVIAFIQDDKTREILQGVQIEVPDEATK